MQIQIQTNRSNTVCSYTCRRNIGTLLRLDFQLVFQIELFVLDKECCPLSQIQAVHCPNWLQILHRLKEFDVFYLNKMVKFVNWNHGGRPYPKSWLTLHFAFHFKPVFKIVCSGRTLFYVHMLEGLLD